MTTILAFIVTLGILIVVHEYGHYRVAKWCGVKVLRFSVGFGKPLWRRQRSADDTEFVVGAIPLGGYVKMLDEREDKVSKDDLHAAFNRKSLGQRTAIVAAGPIANFLLAVLLYACVHWVGTSEPKPILASPSVSTLAAQAGLRAGDVVREWSSDGSSWQVVASMPDLQWAVMRAAVARKPLDLRVSTHESGSARAVRLRLDELPGADVDAATLKRIGLGAPFSAASMGAIRSGGAAHAAGLMRGDRVLLINDEPVADATELRERIRANPERAMRWVVEREGQRLSFLVTPKAVQDTGQTVGRVDAEIGGVYATTTVRLGVWEGIERGAVRTWDVSIMTLRMLGRMLIGEASIKNLSGPLTIADVAGQSAQMGLVSFLGFLALVSVSLGVLNLLPLPMLDGGHLMYYLFEALTGRPVSELWLQRLQRGGAVVLLLMMTVALSNDIQRLFFQ